MNNSYRINQTSRTTSNYVVAGLLASQLLTGHGVTAPTNSGQESLLLAPYRTDSELPSFDQIRSIFGGVPDQGSAPNEFVVAISNFYATLVANQEPLGADFARVLHDNLWDLYER